jgi:mRNA interferase YafQ
MRKIERTTGFKKDFKRESKGQYRTILDEELHAVLSSLVNDCPLDARYRDHDLSNNWSGYRECHIKPDLLLIYRKHDNDILKLARLGSHSELFG